MHVCSFLRNKGMKKILVTGASGFLGWNLCNAIKKDFQVFGTVFSHSVRNEGVNIVQVDLTDFTMVQELIKDIRPEGVIHTAAATKPNYCQEHPEETYKINVDAVANLAGLCADRRIPFVFTSTDLVFNGLNAPYSETDPVSPVNVYGEQKVMAEELVMSIYPEAALCRMPLMYGLSSPSYETFFQAMIKKVKSGRTVQLFVDEYRTPVSGKTAALGLMLALQKGRGILHLGGQERISRYDFGRVMTSCLGYGEELLIACHQKDIVMSAPRAQDLSLNSEEAFALGYAPPPIKNEIEELLINMQ